MAEFYTSVFSRGDKMFVRGYRGRERIKEVINYKPYLFIPARRVDRNTEFRTLQGQPVEKFQFDSMRDARDFIKKYDGVDNMEISGLTNFTYLYIYDSYHGQIDYDVSLINIISLDIETDSSNGFPDIEQADKEITAITLSRRGEKISFGLFPYTPSSDRVTYIHCKDEYELLTKFLHIWQSGRFQPDIVTGWNIEFFDIPYIVNRITRVLGRHEAEKLSPWRFLDEKTVEIHGKPAKVFIPMGISILDYLRLYKKFSFSNQESYKLDHIAEVVLGAKKLDYSEYSSLDELYRKDFQKFMDYNIHDVTLIDMLEEKLGFIELVLAFAYDAKVNYDDTFTTVRPWDIIIHNYLLDRAIVIPQQKKGGGYQSLVGGYVKDPKIGMHRWVVSFDLNSLYPHLIMQYNISAETKLGKQLGFPGLDSLVDKKGIIPTSADHTTAANGVKFSKNHQGFIPALMEKMYDDRTEYKKKMLDAKKSLETMEKGTENYRQAQNMVARYHNLQLAKKIQLNSAYGAMANEYFRWFDFDMAEAITMSGQLSIRWIERKINEYFNRVLKTSKIDYVIASDTDSIYVDFSGLVDTLPDMADDDIATTIDNFVEAKIQPFISKSYEELAEYMNSYQQKMFMKRETIANKGIWKAKKMYILNALDIEGVRFKTPQLKIQGIEAVRSSTPKACKASIKKALEIIMNQDEESVQYFIDKFRIDFMELSFEDVAFPRGMNGIDEYRDPRDVYRKGTPIHVKGALLYNHLIKKKNLENKYQTISDGDKIKFAYLKLPNPLNDIVISAMDTLPREFDLDRYIDKKMQFQKSFLDPLTNILDVIGWSSEKRSTIDGFFA